MTSHILGGSAAGGGGHATDVVLAGYAAGTVDGVAAWSVEAHLVACARCRAHVSVQVDDTRLTRNRSVLLARVAVSEGGRLRRLLAWCGVADHVLGLLAATPSLRRSWLLAVVAVLATMTGEAVLVNSVSNSPAWDAHAGGQLLVPFLLVAPLLVLAGVAAAFVPWLDPSYRLAVAAPLSGFTLLLVRAVAALAAALVPVVCAGFVLPGPGWLPAALLLPSLALCAFALAAATVVGPRVAAVASSAMWVTPVLLLTATRPPLLIVGWHSQAACAAVLISAAVVIVTRRDRFDWGCAR